MEYVTSAPAALLPIKFERAQKEFRPQLPTNDAVPLIHQHRQVAVGLNPFRPHMADDGFRRRADHQRLREFFPAADGDHRQFRRESFHVMFLFVDEAARNEQGKRHVLVARGLEAPV